MPAQLNSTSTGPRSAQKDATASLSSTSSRAVRHPSRLASPASLMSVAITSAPARANARALALPMPWAAAVIRTRWPERSVPVMPCGSFRLHRRAELPGHELNRAKALRLAFGFLARGDAQHEVENLAPFFFQR